MIETYSLLASSETLLPSLTGHDRSIDLRRQQTFALPGYIESSQLGLESPELLISAEYPPRREASCIACQGKVNPTHLTKSAKIATDPR